MPESSETVASPSGSDTAPKLPYVTPTLRVYGDLARLTQSLKNKFGADGHPGNGMSKTG